MADRFDPARAKSETVQALCSSRYPAVEGLRRLLDQLRSECRIPLRTRAEVDAEIAAYVRNHVKTYGPLNYTWDRINELCAEPTAEPHTDKCEGCGLLKEQEPTVCQRNLLANRVFCNDCTKRSTL